MLLLSGKLYPSFEINHGISLELNASMGTLLFRDKKNDQMKLNMMQATLEFNSAPENEGQEINNIS